MAEHSINLGHHIQFNDTCFLFKKSGCFMEGIEIEVCPENMNREEVLPEQVMEVSCLNPEGTEGDPL